jgi:hypothetical protein
MRNGVATIESAEEMEDMLKPDDDSFVFGGGPGLGHTRETSAAGRGGETAGATKPGGGG